MPRPSAIDLKTSLMRRIALCALACAAAAIATVLIADDRRATAILAAKAEVVARNLELQAFRIDAGFDLAARFPDWDFLADRVVDEGLCLKYFNAAGAIAHATCSGAELSMSMAPKWFSVLHAALFKADKVLSREVTGRREPLGRVEISVDRNVAIARAWRDTTQVLAVSLGTIALLSLVIFKFISRALEPAKDLVSGLDRLAQGELEHRLPPFALTEFQEIRDSVNHMAEALQASLAARSDLTRRLAETQEMERRHLARELHDEFGQQLAAMNATAASIAVTAEAQCPALAGEAQELSAIAMKMMTELRHTLARLRPAIVDEVGLEASIAALVADWNARLRGTTRFEMIVEGNCDALPSDTAVNLYRIVQEGLTNAAKHAQARNVAVRVTRNEPRGSSMPDGQLTLTVEDDGEGFSPVEAANGGAGLQGMRERIEGLGGSWAIRPCETGGTCLQASIPLRTRFAEAA